jgi:predicted Zn-dependent protease
MNRMLRIFLVIASFMAVFAMCLPDDASSRSSRKRASQLRDTVSEDDVKAEIQFGREVGARVLGQYALYDEEKLTKYVNLVAASLARNAGRPELTFRVAILKSDNINAYAAPGGYIFVTKGAIMQMENEAELAAVIAHEMAHITGMHIVKELEIRGTDSSASSGITRMVGGAGDPAKAAFASMVDKAVGILFERGYKKEDEKDADMSGVVFTALSGYDPLAMISYFERISEARGDDMEILNKTHPSFDERISLITETIEAEGLDGQEYTKGDNRFNEYKKTI